jgi:hypothetical protein
MTPNARIFDRQARVTVGSETVEGLRIGFTVEKDTTLQPNRAEVVIYNLARSTRERLHRESSTPVRIEAGYRETGRIVIFVGEMREAFSRPEQDGTWATILRAGDGDKALRTRHRSTSLKPGVSFERVAGELYGELKVGAGNLWQALKDGKGIGEALEMGFASFGSTAEQMQKLMESSGLEYSIQDGELQVLKAGEVLSTTATVLSPGTGLEGSPEINSAGTLTARARIMPGLSPGYPVEITKTTPVTLGSGWYSFDVVEDAMLYRIEKTRYVGDTAGQDWNAEIECTELKR